jgi:protein gp37
MLSMRAEPQNLRRATKGDRSGAGQADAGAEAQEDGPMSENSAIAWTDHTFNPWHGCTKVSRECQNCYAEPFAKRFGVEWGPTAARREFGDAHWNEPLRWNRKAEKTRKRAKVFCGSMCDVFEDRPGLDEMRVRLWELIEATPWLDWLLLTKRPENARAVLPTIEIGGWETPRFDNIWLGATVGCRESLPRVDVLRELPATVRFLSCEPLLEDLGGIDLSGIGWLIVGAESSARARPMELSWVRSLRDQCERAAAAFFFKQAVIGGKMDHKPRLDGRVWRDLPEGSR